MHASFQYLIAQFAEAHTCTRCWNKEHLGEYAWELQKTPWQLFAASGTHSRASSNHISRNSSGALSNKDFNKETSIQSFLLNLDMERWTTVLDAECCHRDPLILSIKQVLCWQHTMMLVAANVIISSAYA